MFVGIDVGGTKIAAVSATKQGKILKRIEIETPQAGLPEFIDAVIGIIQKLGGKKIKAVGLGLPGGVDKKGRLLNVPNIPHLAGVDIVKLLKKKLPNKYYIENDANAAALAELKYGAGSGLKNFIYLTISTGIGGGIIIDKKIFRGTHGTAGELGHMIIFPNGPQDNCGNKGCWEALGSGTALARMAQVKIKAEGIKSLIHELADNKLENISGKIIAQAARKKDPLAIELLKVNGYFNALAITNLVNIFDPEAIVIGGGLSFNGKLFFDPLRNALPIFKMLNPDNRIMIIPAKCGKDSGVLGAAALCLAGEK